jgi:hypothetical protein
MGGNSLQHRPHDSGKRLLKTPRVWGMRKSPQHMRRATLRGRFSRAARALAPRAVFVQFAQIEKKINQNFVQNDEYLFPEIY